FFFSSRRRHTRFSRDWSSDVCSSDLRWPVVMTGGELLAHLAVEVLEIGPRDLRGALGFGVAFDEGNRRLRLNGDRWHDNLELVRSEERRVGSSEGLGGCRVVRKIGRR